MYASTPPALEQMLAVLDQVREFIIHVGDQQASQHSGYAKFLMTNGFGVSLFTTKDYPPRELTDKDKKAFSGAPRFLDEISR